MSESSRLIDGRRTTNALLGLILVTLAAGFLYVGGADSGTTHVARLYLSTMLWGPLLVAVAVLLGRS